MVESLEKALIAKVKSQTLETLDLIGSKNFSFWYTTDQFKDLQQG